MQTDSSIGVPGTGSSVLASEGLVDEHSDEREAVRVQTGTREPDDRVARLYRRSTRQQLRALNDADSEAAEVEVAWSQQRWQLCRLAADQRTAALLAACQFIFG